MLYGASINLTKEDRLLLNSCMADDKDTIADLVHRGASPNARDTSGRTPLIIAVENGFSTKVRQLLKHGADVNARAADGSTALHSAVAAGNIRVVRFLLVCEANVNAQDDGGASPLIIACQLDKREIAALLVKNHACNVNLQMAGNMTPLAFSVIRGKYWWVDFLLTHGADPSLKTDRGTNALSLACIYFRTSIAQRLHEHGVAFTESDENNRNLLLQAMMHKERGRYGMVVFLIDKGVPCDIPDNKGRTALHQACEEGDAELVDLFLRHGAQLTQADSAGKTPLIYAVENGHYHLVIRLLSLKKDRQKDLTTGLIAACQKGLRRIIGALIAAGADVQSEDTDGITPLMAACSFEDPALIEWLTAKKRGVVTYANKHGVTALHYACFEERRRLVPLLKELGADLEAVSAEHGTALSIACNQGTEELVTALLEAQAQVDTKGYKGMTALMICCLNNRKELARLLLDHGAQVNCVNDRLQTALLVACQSGAFDCVELLLARGADRSAKTIEGFTALHFASWCGHSRLVDLLIRNGAPVDECGPRNSTPLLLACQTGRLKVVKTLVRHGAEPATPNKDGITPLICAHSYGHDLVVSYLKELGAELPHQAVLSLIPLFLTPKIRQLEMLDLPTVCRYCHEGSASLICQNCKEARYCDATCVEADRTKHLKDCHPPQLKKNGYHKH